MSGKPPAFQFYATDWAHSVSSMTLEERGAYITLLAWSWEHGQLPNDMKRIAVILGVHLGAARRVCVEVLKRWQVSPDTGQWVNRRLEKIRAEQAKFIQKQAANGRLGGRPPKTQSVTQEKPTAKANGKPNESSPISDLQSLEQSPTTEQSEKAPTRELLKLFDECHQNRFDTPAEINGGKDAALMAGVWRKRGTEETERLIRAFFASRDSWLMQSGFSVGVFKSQIPKLLTAAGKLKPRQHWRDECVTMHGGACESATYHDAKARA